MKGYKTRLPGGMMRVVKYDKKGLKVVTYKKPKKKKPKPPRGT
jgi:hypothetical protein